MMTLQSKTIAQSGTLLGTSVVIGLCLAKFIRFSALLSTSKNGKKDLRLRFASSKLRDEQKTIEQFAKQPPFVSKAPFVTQSPDATWKPEQNQPSPHSDEFIEVDPKTAGGVYQLLISGVTPRPIAFVSSMNKAGNVNLAPYSYFNAVSHAPPMIMFSVCTNRDGSYKDTLINIKETGEFTVNIISEWFLESANWTCGNFPYGEDEFEKSGLTKEESTYVKPPRVLESAFQMECKLRNIEEIYKNEQPSDEESKSGKVAVNVVFGQVVMIHVNKNVWDEETKTVDFAKFKPISRLGNINYGHTTKLSVMARPHISK